MGNWVYYTVSHVGIFNPALRTVAPLTSSLVQLSLPLSVSKYSVYGQCGAWRGQGVLSPSGDYILNK
jgi:hypothetical protein